MISSLPLILFCLPVVIALPASNSVWNSAVEFVLPHALPFPALGFAARVFVKSLHNTPSPIDRDCAFNATIYVDPRSASMRFDIDVRPGGTPEGEYPCNNGPAYVTWPAGARTVYISHQTPASDAAIRHVVFKNGTCVRADTAKLQTPADRTSGWYSGPSDCDGDAGGHPECYETECNVGSSDHPHYMSCLAFSEQHQGASQSYSNGWSIISNGTFAGIPVGSYDQADGPQYDDEDSTMFSSLAVGFPANTFKLPDACTRN